MYQSKNFMLSICNYIGWFFSLQEICFMYILLVADLRIFTLCVQTRMIGWDHKQELYNKEGVMRKGFINH